MATKGHLLYYPEGKHDILLGKELNDILKSKVNSVTKITYQDLKDLRDNSKLTPGALYRITDYQCTTTQENTQSAGHQFDIVLLALSENKLAEEGWAMMHDNIYDVTFNDGVTKKCYLYGPYDIDGSPNYNLVDTSTLLGYSELLYGEFTIEGNTIIVASAASNDLIEENLTYNYFQNSNLSAWKVWYCLDNDKSRFAWADDRNYIVCNLGDGDKKYFRNPQDDYTGFYGWLSSDGNSSWTDTETPQVDSYTYDDTGIRNGGDSSNVHAVGNDGRGIIYRLIDEFNNDIKYDFKNIQFKRKITDGQYDATNGTETWCYTLNIWYNDMCQDTSIVGNTLLNDEGFVNGVYDNNFGYATAYDVYIEGVSTFAFALGNNVVLSIFEGDYYGIYSNTIGNSFTNNTIGSSLTNNVIGSNFNSNTIGNYFGENIIGTSFSANTIGNGFYSNTIGNNFMDNTIGNSVNYNMIGNRFGNKTISDHTSGKNYGNNGVELATKDDIGDIETALNNI